MKDQDRGQPKENDKGHNTEKPEIQHPDTPHTMVPNKANEGKDYPMGEKTHHKKPGSPESSNKNDNQKNMERKIDEPSSFQDEPNMSNTRETNNWNQKESDASNKFSSHQSSKK